MAAKCYPIALRPRRYMFRRQTVALAIAFTFTAFTISAHGNAKLGSSKKTLSRQSTSNLGNQRQTVSESSLQLRLGGQMVKSLGDVKPLFQATRSHRTMVAADSDEMSDLLSSRPEVENVVIVGSGPAGYTAAIYAARANLRPIVFEGFRKGGVPGGQLMSTTEVENFPGFPQGITGPDLMDRMKEQAIRWGACLITVDVDSIDLSKRPFSVSTNGMTIKANSIILATGATAKRLGIPRESEFWSRGISSCAICDGASPIFKKKPVAIVGGGDTALEEAMYMTKFASHVYLLVRGSSLKGSKAMQERVLQHNDITVKFNTIVEDAIGEENGPLTGLAIKDRTSGEIENLKVSGMFYGIGHKPNSDIVEGQIGLDEDGYVKVSENGETSVPGVFAAGDLHDTEWRQAITAAGSGCRAAISTERYLTSTSLIQEFASEEERAMSVVGAATETKQATIKEDVAESFDILEAKHMGQYALRKLYHESSRVLAVLYTSPTCGPCRSLKPILNKVVDEYGQDMHYVEIDIVKEQEIAEAAGVSGTPTVQFFKNKALVEVVKGVKTKGDYRAVVEKALQEEKQEVAAKS